MAPQPRYMEIAAALRSRIGVGRQYPPGSKLPTRRELTVEFTTSTITAEAAMREIRDLTVTVHGVGVFVRDDLPEEDPPPAA